DHQSGTATIAVTVTDGSGGTATATFNLAVQPKPDIAIRSARLINPKTVHFGYQTAGLVGTFRVGMFRSEDQVYDSSDIEVDSKELMSNSATSPENGEAAFQFSAEVPFDPAHPYILVVADPSPTQGGLVAESDENDNMVSLLRPAPLTIVVHG